MLKQIPHSNNSVQPSKLLFTRKDFSIQGSQNFKIIELNNDIHDNISDKSLIEAKNKLTLLDLL
ncbi:hypothetical protein H5410_015258 [Solanum commersonii]|uniref:Uncharacterized protein n=1 Tax=Solanum commersonii TaxID=4109 RepID=A0A9J5ZTV2_SOLCO|nr:hypothetical protein H5410_015258 [Solanum commersonii]